MGKNEIINWAKMYILIREDVDLGHAILASAHASLSGYLTFKSNERQTIPSYIVTTVDRWVISSFRKVVCKVTMDEFEKAKTYGQNMIDYRIIVECALDNAEVAIVFKPRNDFESFFKSLKLYN